MGRDIFSRLIFSSQVSLLVGFTVAIISVLIGTLIGAISGYFGGFIDTCFMRLVDVMNSIPLLFLNILILAIFGIEVLLFDSRALFYVVDGRCAPRARDVSLAAGNAVRGSGEGDRRIGLRALFSGICCATHPPRSSSMQR